MPLPLIAAAAVLLVAMPALGADGLPLKRVLLSSGGVGYFEYEASVDGDAVLSLDVRRDQVDDVLKSIVVYDDAGRVGTISLPGEEPLRELFRELPFDADALTSPMALFNALRGAEVRASGTREVTGRLLSVTEIAVSPPGSGAMVTGHRVSLMTANGMQQLVLEEADALRFTDPRLQAQVEGALAAVAQHNTRDRRRLSIHTTGPGKRTVRVAYVALAPLWKASYRLTLPASGSGPAALQGWAILENMSGEDWKDVDLTVVSGHPVTFRQALYSAFYVNRPEVPVDVLGRILPKADEGAVASSARMAEQMPPAPSAAAPAPGEMAAPRRPARMTAADAGQTDTHAVFHYAQPVSLTSGHSLLLPIVVRPVPAESVALYQPATQPRHPLAAVRLTNDGPSALPPGVLTLYRDGEGGATFIGDAQLSPLPAGEQRLLSFAVDQQVKVDRSEKPGEVLSRANMADGLLHLTVLERQTTTYTVAAPPGEPRTVILEHPRRAGWELVEPAGAKPDLTATAYRIPVEVPAGGTAALSVTLERPRVERVALTDLPPERLSHYASSAELPPAFREAFLTLAELRSASADRQRRFADLEKAQADVAREQDRLRQNLGALPQDSDLYKRTLVKMAELETRLDGLEREMLGARRDAAAADKALTDYIRRLRL